MDQQFHDVPQSPEYTSVSGQDVKWLGERSGLYFAVKSKCEVDVEVEATFYYHHLTSLIQNPVPISSSPLFHDYIDKSFGRIPSRSTGRVLDGIPSNLLAEGISTLKTLN